MLKKKRAIVLLSGGLDSAVTLFIAKKSGFDCNCLTFDYGQRHHREIHNAKEIARIANCNLEIININLPWKGSTLFSKSKKISRYLREQEILSSIPQTYVPARNIIFLSFALSYAEANNAHAIFIGTHAQDYSGYPDCRPQFLLAFKRVMNIGTVLGRKIKLIAPVLNKNKAQIIKLGVRLKVPFEHTWSCYSAKKLPCQKCESCDFRSKGFKEAGLIDPALFKKKDK